MSERSSRMSTFLVGLLFSLIVTVLVVPRLRDWFKKIKVAQMVMRTGEHEPDHAAKAGTPTMGGAGFIPVVVIGFIILALITKNTSSTGWATLIAIVVFAIVGAFDDSIKVFNHRDEGLRFLPKLFAEIAAAILGVVVLALGKFDFFLSLPFGLGEWHSVIVYTLFTIFWLVGWSNATNLTDGLDGLASGTAIIAYVAYLVIAIVQGDMTMVLLDGLMIGALLGFMFFNHYPATIFMGDTGSLALGAGLAMNSLVLHHEWSILIIGFVFMVETLSVIIQVTSFHFFKKRIFLMTPIHHSFEKGGLTGNTEKPWNEWQVNFFFWGTGLIMAVIYLLIWFL